MDNVLNDIEILRKLIANKLYHLRTDRKITISNVAQETGLDNITISRYESGKYLQNLGKLMLLAHYYDVPVIYFFQKNNANLH